MVKGKVSLFTEVSSVIAITILGVLSVVFSILYVQTFTSGFIFDYKNIITAAIVSLLTIITIITIILTKKNKSLLYKIFILTLLTVAIVAFSLYILSVSGFLDRIDSVEDFRAYIASFGAWAVILFIILQFLQVVVLPIPSFITVGAGVLLFGPFWSSIYSCIGIISGSIVAYLIGKVFGVKVAKWLVGEDSLKKGLKTIKGKDKIILTFMFIFPFFPDDLLCFVAGITTISPSYFITMIFVTRIICIFASSYSFNNSIIPYDTWWGICLWILFFALTIVLTILVYNKGEKIEKIISNKNKKRKKNTA
ncbi:MAG: TVP38/TMEM64 family protein [Clostridiales bacterium]|nr:TVP38/TMEM64 family protein [Clostridiales bacterium]